MPDQIYIGNFAKGLKLDRLPFNIDNDSFPYLYNFYSWRGRLKRKRGTLFLARLQKQIELASPVVNPWQTASFNLSSGAGNLITALSLGGDAVFASIVSGSISLTVGANTYTEPATPNGTLVGTPSGSGTINYATGAITIAGGGSGTVTGTFSYYTGLPSMGLRDFILSTSLSAYPLLLAFDTDYSYQINQSSNSFYNTTYYKETDIPFKWHGLDYQQFWTVNYQSALWATNNVPGFHFVDGTYTSGSGTSSITFNFKSSGVDFEDLIVGDKLWFNEWSAGGSTLNGSIGTVSDISGAATGDYVISFDASKTAAGTGIAQLLTNSIPNQDGIRWYDGDPTSGSGIPDNTGLGWVNFAPPLTAASVSIDDKPSDKYYLVGALAIVPFKDRLLFFKPYIQTKTGTAIQLEDTVIWSWNGTPYYADLTPTGETSDPTAYYVDQTGKGGYQSARIAEPIVSVTSNEDVLLVGFTRTQTRFVYTGNDLYPFLFFAINSELGTSSTFAAVSLDRGGVTVGPYGIVLTTQQSSQRIDLDIPDSVFQINASNNGAERINGIRDYFREWIYFSYPDSDSSWKFPTQTFLYNYRDDTWAILYENFTTHGTFRRTSGYTWSTLPFRTWAEWREPWNSGSTAAQFPSIVAGTPQGYVLIKGQGTGEGKSGTIKDIAASDGNTQITSYNHCVQEGDYLYIQDCLGTTSINGLIGRVIETPDADTFVIDLPFPAGTYLGLGDFTRLSQPYMQTKQFPFYWDQGRQTRLGVQKYLLDKTADAQVTLQIYLSQDPNDPWNDPAINPTASDLIYSQVLLTCPENGNLQSPTAQNQLQIWHRVNTSLIGDSIQIGITLSDAQMRDLTYATSEITLHGMQLTVDRGPLLS